MEISSITPLALQSQLVINPVEVGDLCTFQPPYKLPTRHRLLRARAGGAHGRSRASSSMPETDSRRRSSYTDSDESDNVSVWDSNAEGVRGSWRARKTSSFGSKPVEDSPNVYASGQENSWQWWQSGPDDDDYERDVDDDDEEDSWFSLDNFDAPSAISMLRWMVPAAALFLPWLFGGPMFLMMAFAFFPLVQKLLGLFLPSAWKAALQGRNASSKSRQREGRFWRQPKNDSLDEESDFFNTDVEDWETSFLRSSMDRGSKSKLGGWGGEADKASIQKTARRGKKKAALQRRWSRKEMPLLFRLLVAVFPFLRSWGGFL